MDAPGRQRRRRLQERQGEGPSRQRRGLGPSGRLPLPLSAASSAQDVPHHRQRRAERDAGRSRRRPVELGAQVARTAGQTTSSQDPALLNAPCLTTPRNS